MSIIAAALTHMQAKYPLQVLEEAPGATPSSTKIYFLKPQRKITVSLFFRVQIFSLSGPPPGKTDPQMTDSRPPNRHNLDQQATPFFDWQPFWATTHPAAYLTRLRGGRGGGAGARGPRPEARGAGEG